MVLTAFLLDDQHYDHFTSSVVNGKLSIGRPHKCGRKRRICTGGPPHAISIS